MFDLEKTRHLAELSKLSFSEEELFKMTVQMTDIIALMDEVQKIDKNIPEYTQAAVSYADLRADEAKPSLATGQVLQNAKETKDNSFVVPKVV